MVKSIYLAKIYFTDLSEYKDQTCFGYKRVR